MYVQCGSVLVMQMYCLNVKLIEKKKLGLHELFLVAENFLVFIFVWKKQLETCND